MIRKEWLLVGFVLAGCASRDPAELTGQTGEAISQCPTTSVEGVDVFDGQGSIDWPTVYAAGVRFAFIKATQGTYDTQSLFARNWEGAKAAGLVRGAYHFFDPTEDGVAQAQHFLAVAGLGAGDLPGMLDIECPDASKSCLYADASGAASAADIASRMDAFLREVEAATGKRPILYTFGSYFADNKVDAAGVDADPLFIADPTTATCVGVPAPWSTAAFWQYSWTGTVGGITGEVDRDRFLGDWAQLEALASGLVDAGLQGAGADAAVAEAPADVAPTKLEGGCSCREAGGGSGGRTGPGWALVAALLTGGRRRRALSHAPRPC